MRWLPVILTMIAAVLWTQTGAIIIRHDRDGLAGPEATRSLRPVAKVLPDGESVLVAPRWVLTAAHVATGAPLERIRVRIDSVDYRVTEVFPVPGWKPGNGDIALMRLARPVSGVTPLPIGYDVELGRGTRVTLAGRGDHGDGERGVDGNDGRLRVGGNAITEIEDGRFAVRLDRPDEGALPDEAVSGPGDSGTPALVEVEGSFVVVGIGSVGRSPKGQRYGHYGSDDVFIRVSRHRDWIESVLSGE